MGYRDNLESRYGGAGVAPLDAYNMGTPPPDKSGYVAQDQGLAARSNKAVADLLAGTNQGIPEEPGREGVGEYSLAENLIALPGDSLLESGLETMATRAGELVVGAADLIGSAEEAVFGTKNIDWALRGREGEDTGFFGLGNIEEQVQAIFGSRELVDAEYPEQGWESLKRDWNDPNVGVAQKAYNVAQLIAKEGPASMADAVAAVFAPAAYIGTRTGEIAEDRSQSTGEPTTIGDLAIAGTTAVVVQQMEKLGFDAMFMNNPATRKAVDAIASKVGERFAGAMVGGVAEAATEAPQEFLEGLATLVKDDLSNLDLAIPQAAENALVGAIVGGGVGSALGALNNKPKVEEGPGEDAEAAVAATTPALPGPEERLALPAPPKALPAPPKALPAPTNATQEAPPEEPDTGASMEFPQGVLDDGQQDFISPPPEPVELPESVGDTELTDDLRYQQLQEHKDARVGSELRDSGLGKLVTQAIRGKASKSAMDALEAERKRFNERKQPRQKEPGERLTEEDRLERLTAQTKAARTSTPGPALVELFENLARLHVAKASAANDREGRGVALDRTDEFQGAAALVQDAVASEAGTGMTNRVLGTIQRLAPAFESMGLPVTSLLEATTPVEARKALDTISKEAKNKVITELNAGADLTLPPRISLDPTLAGQSDEKSRDIRSVMSEAERQNTYTGKSSAATMTPEGMHATIGTDEEGNYRVTSTAPKESEEAKERRALIKQRDATEARRTEFRGSGVGKVTDYTIAEDQYEDIRDEGGNVIQAAQPVTKRPKDTPSGRVDADTQSLEEIDARIADLEDERTGTKGKARLAVTRQIQELEAQKFRMERGGYAGPRVAPSELAGELRPGKTKAPGNSGAKWEATKRRLQAKKDALNKYAKGEVDYEDRLAAAQRAGAIQEEADRVALKAAKDRKAAEEKAAKELAKLDERGKIPPKKPKEPKSAPEVVRERGQGSAAVAAAGKVYSKYKREFKKHKKGVAPATIAAYARQRKAEKIGPNGLPPVLVFNAQEPKPRRMLYWVNGAYPRRTIHRGKDGRVTKVTRADAYKPAADAPFNALKNKKYYTPEEVQVVRGRSVAELQETPGMGGPRVVRAQLGANEVTVLPDSMDRLLEFLGTVDFPWDGKPNEQAMAEYLLGQVKSARAPSASAEQKKKDELAERPTPTVDNPPAPEIEYLDEDDDLDVADETIDDIDIDILLPFLEGNTDDRDDGPSLKERIDALRNDIDAAYIDVPYLEEVTRSTPIDNGALVVEPHAAWPFPAVYSVADQGDGTTADPYGIVSRDVAPGESVDEALVQHVMEMANGSIASAEVRLAQLEKQYAEELAAAAKRGEDTPRKPTTDRPGKVPAAARDPEDDPTRGPVRAYDDRVPGIELAPKREAIDLYAGVKGIKNPPAPAIERARAYQFSGADGRLSLSNEQVFGVAKLFYAWQRALDGGPAGFLNIDATGFGKARQVAASAQIISDVEAESGRNRPVAIMFPGGVGSFEYDATDARHRFTNALGDNVAKDMQSLEIDPRATYDDGSPRFVFKSYNELQKPDTTEYAAVLADEAHGVKGNGPVAKGFDNLNSDFRAFFSATPTDMAGQELYYLKHMSRVAGEDIETARKRLAGNLNLSMNTDGGFQLGTGEPEIENSSYTSRLSELLGRLVRSGHMVSRSFGRLSRNFTETVPEEHTNHEAKRMYDELFAQGRDATDPVLVRLTEHMKVPYMVARAAKRVTEDNNKVIAAFTISSAVTDKKNPLFGTPFAEPAIRTFQKQLTAMDIPTLVLAGEEAKNATEAKLLPEFQGTETRVGHYKVLALTDARGATGLNLNDTMGDNARYMMIARTSFQGASFMQLLGRHDRNNNKSIPYTEFVRLDNPTDLDYRKRIAAKIRLQEVVSGVAYAAADNPDMFLDKPIYTDDQFLKRLRAAQFISDPIDETVNSMIGKGAKLENLLHTIAVGAKDTGLSRMASDLLAAGRDLDAIPVRLGDPTALVDQMGNYNAATGEISMNPEGGMNAQTLVHEVVHALTARRIATDFGAQSQLLAIREAMRRSNPSLAERFPNAFGLDGIAGLHEFIAEAFSDPAFQHELHKTTVKGTKTLSMFQRFIRWVASVVGLKGESYNALRRIMDLDLLSDAGGLDFEVEALHELSLPRAMPKAFKNSKLFEKFTQSNVGMTARFAQHKARRGMLWTMTYDQIVDTYAHLAERTVASRKPGGNILRDFVSMREAISAKANQNNKEYQRGVTDPLRAFAQGKGKEMIKVRMREGGPVEVMTQLEYLANLMNISGYAKVHFGAQAGDTANSALKTDATARAAWKLHHKQASRKEFTEAMKTYNRLASFFKADRGRKMRVIKGAYLDAILGSSGSASWVTRPAAAINAKLVELGSMDEKEQKVLGVSKGAIDQLQDVLRPGSVSGAYFPLRRYGDYVVVVDGDQPYYSDKERDELLGKYPNARDDKAGGLVKYKTVARFETPAEAERYRQRLEEDFKDNGHIRVREVQLKTASDADMMGADSPSLGLITSFQTQLDKRGLEPAEAKTIKSVFAQAMLDMLPETSVANAMRERKGIHGASLDIQRVLHNYGASQGYLMANLEFSRTQTALATDLREHTYEQSGEDHTRLEQVRQEIIKRESGAAEATKDLGAIGQKMSDVGFVYYLVGASYNLVNMTQVPLVTAPYLAARYKETDAVKAIGRAYRTVGAAPALRLIKTGGTLTELRQLFKGGDFNRENYDVLHGDHGIISGLTDENHKRMLARLENEGHIEASLAMDMGRMAARPHVDANGKSIKTGVWDYFTDWMRMAPHITEVMNRSVTAVAAFDLEYAKSKDYDKALDVARQAVKQTQFVYQGWNKPHAFQHRFGRIMLMFKQHVQHMYYFMFRNAAMAIKGKTAEEKKVGRKALLYLAGVHMLAAGAVGGTPEVAKWIINLLFWAASDEDEPVEFERWVRNGMYDLFGGEEGYGNVGATLASHGLPGFIGMDLSGRVGIDSMLLYGAPDFSTRDGLARFAWDTAGGPMAGLVAKALVDAPNAYRQGDYQRMLEAAMPKAIRDPLQAHRFSSEGMKDLSGKTFLNADELDWADYGLKVLGFAPTTVSDVYESRNVGNSRRAIDNKRRTYFTRFYTAETAEDRQAVIDSIREWNKRNPDFPISRSQLVQSVKQRRRQEALTEGGVYTPTSRRDWVREQQRSY